MTDEDASMKTGPGEWAVADDGDAERPTLVRVRTDLNPTNLRTRWPNRLAVVWCYPLEGPEGQRGLPTGPQQGAMAQLEDALTRGLEDRGVGVLTSVATSSGQREWIWYCRPAGELNPAFNAALKGHPRYHLNCICPPTQAGPIMSAFALRSNRVPPDPRLHPKPASVIICFSRPGNRHPATSFGQRSGSH